MASNTFLCSCSFVIGVLDVAFGSITVFATFLEMFLSRNPIDQSTKLWIKWCGIASIGTVAAFEQASGLLLINKLCQLKEPKGYSWKSGLYFISEILGYAIPFFAIQDYNEILDELIEKYSGPFKLLVLLKVNPLTIGLFIFQLFSYFVVNNYIKAMRASRWKRAVRTHLEKQRTNKNAEKPIAIPLLPIVQSASAQLSAQKSNCDNSSSFLGKTKIAEIQLAKRNSLYPSITDFNIEDEDDTLTSVYISSESDFDKKKALCSAMNKLYEDPDFPVSKMINGKLCIWKRPLEIHPEAKFISNGVCRFDVKQGGIGNCWFVAALANLTLRRDLFDNVVPSDNEINFKNKNEYAGIFHFKFNLGSTWKEVIIDDRLPVNPNTGQLRFISSSDPVEFWGSLLEKAYAKFKGSYEALIGGLPSQALKDFTGFSSEQLKVPPTVSTPIFSQIKQAIHQGHFVATGNLKKGFSRDGLYGGHAYSITGAEDLTLNGSNKRVKVIRIRNPWGNENEWTGEWSDKHPLWKDLDSKTKRNLKLRFDEDGEFWFPFSKFHVYFDLVEICYISN